MLALLLYTLQTVPVHALLYAVLIYLTHAGLAISVKL